MARIDKSRRQGARANAASVKPAPRRRGTTAPSIEDTMFFPRLRRHAKWVFVFLALFFGLGFVLFGVGAGGIGFGDILKNNGGGGGTSVKKALAETRKHPSSATAWSELSSAYQTSGDTDHAISAQLTYTQLRPKDGDGLRTLAGLYLDQARSQATIATNAQSNTAYSGMASPVLGPDANGRQFFSDPLADAFTAAPGSAYGAALQKQQTALANAVATYQRVAALSPNDPNTQFELATNAEAAGNNDVAIAAFRKFLKLAPDSSDAPLVRRELNRLAKAAATSGSGG